jgi:hypothetical protein
MASERKKWTRSLLEAAIGLTPIALSYGAMPQQTLPWLFGIPIARTNETHIFRAFMRLYLALAAFWATGSFRRKYRQPALWSLVVIMLGLAAGRALSIILHGWPY